MKRRIKAIFRKIKRESKRLTAIMCLFGTGFGAIIPGIALAAQADNPAEPAAATPELVQLNFNQSSYESAEEASGEIVVISKQYSDIYYATEPIPFDTVYLSCDFLPSGVEQTVFAGENGVMQFEKADLPGEDGAVAVTLETNVITEAQSAVVLVGTGASSMSPYAIPFTPDSVDKDTGVMTLNVEGENLQIAGVITCKATAYCGCALCCGPGASGITSTGTVAHVGTIAVDPSVIPYGTKLFIVSDDGCYIYGYACAEDCGGAVRGNIIDLFFNTHSEAINFGRRTCTVYVLAP